MSNPNPDQSGLKPWKPGQSGNPKGLPKGRTFEQEVQAILAKKFPGHDFTNREQTARKFVEMLTKGNLHAIRDLMEREWPKILKVQDVTPAAELEEHGAASKDLEQIAAATSEMLH